MRKMEWFSYCCSGLPYTVNQDQALQYPEVQKRLAQAITTLKEVTLAFCDQITTNRDVIPYAMLYMAKVMRQALQRRFPHIPEKEILKVGVIDLFLNVLRLGKNFQCIKVLCIDRGTKISYISLRCFHDM